MGAPQYEQAGADIGGTGTTNTIPRWTGPSTLGDSVITQSGNNIGFGLGANTPISRWHALVPNSGASPTASDWTSSFSATGDYRSGFGFQFSAGAAASNRVTCLVSNGTATGQTAVWTADGSGNVGFGTASPLAKVHSVIADGVTYSYGASGTTKGFRVEHSAVETRIVGVDNTLNASYQPLVLGGSTLGFNTGGTTRALTIDATQQVGIGTASPTDSGGWSAGRILDVRSGSAGSSAVIYVGDSGRVTNTQLGFYGTGYGFVGTVTNYPFRILQNNALRGEWTTTSLDISSTSGYGLKLPATPGNADAQTLDCYAEGTWTPTLTGFGGTTPTVTSARYTRVGRTVLLEVSINATGGATYSGTRAATYLSLPAGMVPPTISAAGAMTDSGINTLGTAVAYYNGNLYLPTFAATAVNTFVTVSYSI